MVLGGRGQLGRTLLATVPAGIECVGNELPDLDITDREATLACLRSASPSVVVNAAAYTAVDKAESERELAWKVNAEGARIVAEAASSAGARLVHVSTDFVFDGRSDVPYRTDSKPRPLSAYGQSKRDGELAVLDVSADRGVVIRTAWLYSRYGNNFVKTILRLLRERDELKIVDDQQGTPTWCNSVAGAVWTAVRQELPGGVYHWTDEGETTWFGFASAIYREARSLGLVDRDVKILPISTSDYPTAAARPAYSVLDCVSTREALNLTANTWESNLETMLRDLARQ